MAQQKFSNSFREALWETHGKKCFHCRRELLFRDMRVDHIVPEHLHDGDADARAAVLSEIGLPSDFDILGQGNLAPSCDDCNSKKSGSILIGSSAAVALTRIKRSFPALEENLKKQRIERSLDSILRSVARSVKGGVYSLEDLKQELNKMDLERDGSPSIVNLEVGKIYNRTPTLGFTPNARRIMDQHGLNSKDLARTVLDNFYDGEATAVRHRSFNNYYVIRGKDGFRLVFAIYDKTVVVLSLGV